ncbi:MAG: hypothetical protein KAR00_00490 [Candidatus Pacebacteria bacterium]|nr:hypothetical protein [Candidatus Paceibacterota bacterium]
MRRDFSIVVLSVLLAVILAQSGIFEHFLTATRGTRFLGSFIAGIFFTSFFTVAPAAIALGEIAQSGSLLFTAFWGGLGAVVGDMLIFLFVRDRLARDISLLIARFKYKKWFSLFQWKPLKFLAPIAGAIIIASPLPDEIGLTLMGISKTRTITVIPLSFTLNFIGILIIGGVARAFL